MAKQEAINFFVHQNSCPTRAERALAHTGQQLIIVFTQIRVIICEGIIASIPAIDLRMKPQMITIRTIAPANLPLIHHKIEQMLGQKRHGGQHRLPQHPVVQKPPLKVYEPGLGMPHREVKRPRGFVQKRADRQIFSLGILRVRKSNGSQRDIFHAFLEIQEEKALFVSLEAAVALFGAGRVAAGCADGCCGAPVGFGLIKGRRMGRRGTGARAGRAGPPRAAGT